MLPYRRRAPRVITAATHLVTGGWATEADARRSVEYIIATRQGVSL